MAGVSRDTVKFVNEDFVPEGITEVFLKYEALITKGLVENLKKSDRVSTGALSQSIRFDVTDEETIQKMTLYMEDYWQYVDEGRKKGGKQPPIDSILKFIRNRGIAPTAPKRKLNKASKKISMDKRRRSLAFIISRSIAKKGIKPTDFYTDTVTPQLEKDIADDIGKAISVDIKVEFNRLNDLFNG